MPRQARGEYLDPSEVQIVHAVQRCVRRAFLCGKDVVTGESFEHRQAWIRDRMEFLASVFAVDCLTYTVLSNHLHVVLRSRPDVATSWSDDEVARRWLGGGCGCFRNGVMRTVIQPSRTMRNC